MTSLTKDEVVKMAREAGFIIGRSVTTGEPNSPERFATLCRAPLVAEVERLKKDLSTVDVILEECKMDWSGDVTQIKAEYAHELLALQADRDDWKARAEAAEAELARVRAGKPVLWQYRWTNPSGDPYQESQMDWKQVKPTWNQTVQQNCDELLAYRFEGKPIYEVRALYATPPRPAAQEPVGVFVSDAEFGRIDLVPHHGAPMVDGQAVYATPPSAVPVVGQLVEALSRNRIMAADSDGNYTREVTPRVITAAIAAGQQYLKENGK